MAHSGQIPVQSAWNVHLEDTLHHLAWLDKNSVQSAPLEKPVKKPDMGQKFWGAWTANQEPTLNLPVKRIVRPVQRVLPTKALRTVALAKQDSF